MLSFRGMEGSARRTAAFKIDRCDGDLLYSRDPTITIMKDVILEDKLRNRSGPFRTGAHRAQAMLMRCRSRSKVVKRLSEWTSPWDERNDRSRWGGCDDLRKKRTTVGVE
jgi:hypothetical protein